MILKIKYSILISILCLSVTTLAQTRDVAGIFNRDVTVFYPAKNLEVFDSRSKELVFENPISNDWEQAELVTMDNILVKTYLLKYNAYSKDLFLKKDNEVIKVPIAYFREFEIISASGNRKFVKLLVDKKPEFLEVIYQNDISLLKHFECELLKSNYNALLDGGDYNDKISVVESYFLRDTSGKLFKIPRKKKQALAFFKGKNSGSARFISSEKLKTKEEQDLIKIFKYLNKEK